MMNFKTHIMKKATLKSLNLNKKLVTKFEYETVKGGVGPTYNKTCRRRGTCFLCE